MTIKKIDIKFQKVSLSGFLNLFQNTKDAKQIRAKELELESYSQRAKYRD